MEIDLLQEKFKAKTEKLDTVKHQRNDLTNTLDETETHLKQVNRNEV